MYYPWSFQELSPIAYSTSRETSICFSGKTKASALFYRCDKQPATGLREDHVEERLSIDDYADLFSKKFIIRRFK
jgi:hypothetical protein